MRKFGEIVADEGYATDEDIARALKYQNDTDILLGHILVDMRKITNADSDRVGEYLKGEGKGKRFGEAAITLGVCSGDDVHAALEFQRTSKGLLGELLIALGYITEQQRNEIIEMQMSEMGG